MITNILVVCIGNICRSPMGEELLKVALPDVKVSSAGLAAMVGHGADPTSIKLMEENGLDITAHRARMLTESLARESDLILVMDTLQVEQLTKLYPYTMGKVFRLGDPIKSDIPDPYQHSETVFRDSYSLIQQGCSAWTKRILTLR